jgi:hypothetical protein
MDGLPRTAPTPLGRKIGQQTPMKEIHISQEIVDKRRGRIVVDGLGRSNLLQSALIQNGDTVGNLQRLFLIVRNEHGGHMQFIVNAAQPELPAAALH